MLKTKAIELLGGTVASAAKRIGIRYQAVDKWPEVLPDRIVDRVIAALAKESNPELRLLLGGVQSTQVNPPTIVSSS